MATVDTLSLLVGIAGLVATIIQTLRIANIEERNYNDTLNTATTAQKALAWADDTMKAFNASPPEVRQKLDPDFARCLASAHALAADVVAHCGNSLAITHKKQVLANWQRLTLLPVVHGQLRKAIESNLNAPLPQIKINTPAHGSQVDEIETVKVKSESPNPIRFFVFNDGVWHSQDPPAEIAIGTWEGKCYFGVNDSKSGSKFKLAVVATGVATEWKIKDLPIGQKAEIEVTRK
jgi:hypothetical protein